MFCFPSLRPNIIINTQTSYFQSQFIQTISQKFYCRIN